VQVVVAIRDCGLGEITASTAWQLVHESLMAWLQNAAAHRNKVCNPTLLVM